MLVGKQQSTRRFDERLPSCHLRPGAVACTLVLHYITYRDRTIAPLLACLPSRRRFPHALPRHWPCVDCNRRDVVARQRRTSASNATRRLYGIVFLASSFQCHLRVIHCAGQSTVLHISRSMGRSCFCDRQSPSGSTNVRVVASPVFLSPSTMRLFCITYPVLRSLEHTALCAYVDHRHNSCCIHSNDLSPTLPDTAACCMSAVALPAFAPDCNTTRRPAGACFDFI